jgi:hypothetical protein
MRGPSLSINRNLVRLLIILGVGILIAASLSWRSPFAPTAQAQTPAAPMDKMTAPKQAAPPSTSLTVTVAGKATTFSVADLSAMPQTTVKLHNEHTKADETYSGVSLGDLLAKAGFTLEQSTHRTMLRSYLTAEGTDKYWVLYSLTEVEASQHNGDVIVATSIDGKPLGHDGALKLISTEDKKPQRWVRNLSAITLKSAD